MLDDYQVVEGYVGRLSMIVVTDFETFGPDAARAATTCGSAVRTLAERGVPIVFVPAGAGAREMELLLGLYWPRREEGIVVGLSDRNVEVLRHADVPIIIRNPELDQTPLREELPQAYCTEAAGSEGWVEAIVGSAG